MIHARWVALRVVGQWRLASRVFYRSGFLLCGADFRRISPYGHGHAVRSYCLPGANDMQRTIAFMLVLLGTLFPLTGCRYNYATESMDAIILYRGTPVTVEAFGHSDLGHGLAYANPESSKFQLQVEGYADICESGGRLPKGFPKTLLMVVVPFDNPRGPAADAFRALGSIYPNDMPAEQMAVMISVDPLRLAVMSSRADQPRRDLSAIGGEAVSRMMVDAMDFPELRYLPLGLVTDALLDLTVDSVIEIAPDGQPMRTEVEKTVRALMCEHAIKGDPGIFKRNRGWRDE